MSTLLTYQFLGIDPDPGNEYTVPNQYGTESIVYNSATVKTPPTSWADL
ncbi:MAG TPA: hypothetical protein VJL59_23935 [Anaerolineales bacterium]|nr:hypothetical protein [Anaerolineales bacterium]